MSPIHIGNIIYKCHSCIGSGINDLSVLTDWFKNVHKWKLIKTCRIYPLYWDSLFHMVKMFSLGPVLLSGGQKVCRDWWKLWILYAQYYFPSSSLLLRHSSWSRWWCQTEWPVPTSWVSMWPSLAIGVPRIDSGMCMWPKKNKLVSFLRLIYGFDGWRMSNSTVIAKQGTCASGAEGCHLVWHTHRKSLPVIQQVEISIAERRGRREAELSKYIFNLRPISCLKIYPFPTFQLQGRYIPPFHKPVWVGFR